MNPIDLLTKEHEKIIVVADALDKESSLLEKGKGVNEEFLINVIKFIRNYADKFHHAKEEDILFKELCKKENEKNMHCNPVEQMLIEHDEGRKFIKGIEDGMKEKNKKKIINNAIGYVNLIREHIFKEDNILYPMSKKVLNKKAIMNMSKDFDNADKKMNKEKEKQLAFFRSLK
mgnify:CR=1 FL=1